jgi:hypothetical protein
MAIEQKPCCACGKRAAINEGLCFWCTLEYAKHQADFDATQPTIEDMQQ